MPKKEWNRDTIKGVLKSNVIIRLLISYFLVLLLVVSTSAAGFSRALHIVENNTIAESSYLLQQSSNEADHFLENLYYSGMKLVSSSELRQLGMHEEPLDITYYYQVQDVLSSFSQALQYVDDAVYMGSFIYINKADRVLFKSGVCRVDTFRPYLEGWGIDEETWAEMTGGQKAAPHLYASEKGELFYMFPCMTSVQGKSRVATVFFHMDRNFVLDRMQFLKNYSGYSLFIRQNGENLLALDNLGVAENIPDMSQQPYCRVGNKLFLRQSSNALNGEYLLVLPENEVLAQIRGLRRFLFIPSGLAVLVGILLAVYSAVKTGKPINNIVRKVTAVRGEDVKDADLFHLDAAVSQIIEEQQADRGVLQQTFFHNLLKADFVSRSELEYMAQRAGIQLVGKEYYAVAVRLFPQIDENHIDGQTVEEARALQLLLSQHLQERYFPELWAYKRNTLVAQYIIKTDDVTADRLVQAVQETMCDLRQIHRAESCWGISSKCCDLMNFWRNGEEALAAMNYAVDRAPVLCYHEVEAKDQALYLPYSAEERLAQGLRSGDSAQVEQTLEMLREENVRKRRLDRRQLSRLSQRLVDIAAVQCTEQEETDALERLRTWFQEQGSDSEAYFTELETVACRMCSTNAGQKSQKRSDKSKAILRFTEENFCNQDMGLTMVSRHFGLSEGYLSILFKEKFGVNFGDYLEDLRMKEACRLLKEGVKVSEISERTGYNSVQSFRRAFKRVTGVSPSEYRVG